MLQKKNLFLPLTCCTTVEQKNKKWVIYTLFYQSCNASSSFALLSQKSIYYLTL
jgi:hypothetical protein